MYTQTLTPAVIRFEEAVAASPDITPVHRWHCRQLVDRFLSWCTLHRADPGSESAYSDWLALLREGSPALWYVQLAEGAVRRCWREAHAPAQTQGQTSEQAHPSRQAQTSRPSTPQPLDAAQAQPPDPWPAAPQPHARPPGTPAPRPYRAPTPPTSPHLQPPPAASSSRPIPPSAEPPCHPPAPPPTRNMASAKAPAISAVLIPSQTQPAAPTQASASPSRQAPASDPTRTSIQPRTSPSLAPQAQLPKPPRLPDTSPTPQAQLPTPPRLPDTSPTPLAQLPTPPRLPTTPASQPSRQLLFPSPPVHSWDDVALLIHEEMRRRHYSVHTLKCYQGWIRRFASFLGQRSPSSLSDQDARSFLSHLAVQSQVSAKTQNQALHAVVFLFRQLLGRPIDNLKGVERASEKRRLPQVLDRDKVRLLLERIHGLPGLMARLCYGCGLRLEECLSLRVKDIDFDRRQLTVRHGKGDKDRVVPLPRVVMEPLLRQITTAAELHQRDLAAGLGAVELPGALDRKLPGAARERAWQWIFPGRRVIVYPDGVARRPHLHPSVLQRALTRAVRELQLDSRVTVHTLRHCFATHLLEDGVNIRRLQELLGHSSVQTTMIYTHVRVQPLESAAFSPLDRL